MKIRDKRTRGWLWVQNQIVDHWMHRMGPAGMAMYLVLARYADQQDQRSWPSHATIAAKMGVCRRTVIRTMKLLEELGLIEVERTHKENGAQTTNTYYLLDPPCDTEAPAPVSDSHTPGDARVTPPPPLHIEVEQDPPTKQAVVERTPPLKATDAIVAIWCEARGVTAIPQDHTAAQAIIEQHGEGQALRLVRVLATVVARRYPDGRRLAYAWETYGQEALEAVRSEERAEKRKQETRKRVEQWREESEVARREREQNQSLWVAVPQRQRDEVVAHCERRHGNTWVFAAQAELHRRLGLHPYCGHCESMVRDRLAVLAAAGDAWYGGGDRYDPEVPEARSDPDEERVCVVEVRLKPRPLPGFHE